MNNVMWWLSWYLVVLVSLGLFIQPLGLTPLQGGGAAVLVVSYPIYIVVTHRLFK